jgi:uncharacterized membrane protein
VPRSYGKRIRRPKLVDAMSVLAGNEPRAYDLAGAAGVLGVIAAGAVLLEAALVPGIVIGGAAVLLPRFLPRLRKRTLKRPGRSRIGPAIAAPTSLDGTALPRLFPKLALNQAIAKTITFRLIATTLDFSANYILIGEIATAAGLSAFALVVGPVFYFVHETAWNYYSPARTHTHGSWGPSIDLPMPFFRRSGVRSSRMLPSGLTINRAPARTITFHTVATTMDFTTNYVVIGNVATAGVLSLFGFIVGPFVYLGHEMIWDRNGTSKLGTIDHSSPIQLASPASSRMVAARSS